MIEELGRLDPASCTAGLGLGLLDEAIKSLLGRPVARWCASLVRLAVVSSRSRAGQSLVATASAILARSVGS